jgi:hypothetical protein
MRLRGYMWSALLIDTITHKIRATRGCLDGLHTVDFFDAQNNPLDTFLVRRIRCDLR